MYLLGWYVDITKKTKCLPKKGRKLENLKGTGKQKIRTTQHIHWIIDSWFDFDTWYWVLIMTFFNNCDAGCVPTRVEMTMWNYALVSHFDYWFNIYQIM